MKHKWIIRDSVTPQRLDVFIATKLTDITRSHIAKLLKNSAGTVNGKTASVHQFLKTGDVVEFNDTPPKKTIKTTKEENNNGDTKKENYPSLHIIKETKDWIVLDKPAGLLVHTAPGKDEETLVDQLLEHDPKIAKIGEDPERPGIVHRLDREVSGLMVVARTQDAFDDLKRQFTGHEVEKKYMAMVHGQITDDEGDIKFRIARSKTKARMAARPVHEKEGKAAWTHFKTLKRYRKATLLELDILSGRTHQIRAHLLAFNHPVMGDPLYNRRAEDRGVKATRLMLQSMHLKFKDPDTGEFQTFDILPVPEFALLEKQLA
ncbi:MAG: RluA family pseudouridine synthase [Patescibacteria group bacterium]